MSVLRPRFSGPLREGAEMTSVFESPHDLSGAVGTHLGYSDWVAVDQARIDLFAEATGDRRWSDLLLGAAGRFRLGDPGTATPPADPPSTDD